MRSRCPYRKTLLTGALSALLAMSPGEARTPAGAAKPTRDSPPPPMRALALPDPGVGNPASSKRAPSSAPWTMWRDGAHQTPVFVQFHQLGGPSPKRLAAASPEAEVLRFITENAELFRLRDPSAELVHRATRRDRRGAEHVHLEHRYLGVPVWGSSIVGHWSAERGLYAINGRYGPTPDHITGVEPSVTREAAVERALGDPAVKGAMEPMRPETRALLGYRGPEADLYLWSARLDEPVRLTWSVEIRPNAIERWHCFVDAHSGRVLDRYMSSPSDGPVIGRGVDLHDRALDLRTLELDELFYLIDVSRTSLDYENLELEELTETGALLTLDALNTDVEKLEPITSADNEFADATAVSAHANMERVYEYFLENHDRRGIAGDGSSMISVVHVTEDGQPMENAYWNGVFIAYGDGGEVFSPLAGALDVAAHEMTHGIIEATVNLEYRFQSGALNESFADIFGVMVDDEDWLVGEDIVNEDYFASGAMRDLRDPHNGDTPGGPGWQPAHMDEYLELPEDDDNGGVHINSGIPNRAAYLLAEAIGREKAARIYYRILEASYLTARSQFVDCRLAAERAALDLFGEDSPEVDAVSRAYDAVGISLEPAPPEEEPETPPPSETAGPGAHWTAAVAAGPDGDNSLWLIKPTAEVDPGRESMTQLTTTQVFARTGHAITAPVKADFLLFIDSDNNVRFIGADGSDETVIDDEGDVSSIALSPDGRRLVATTVYEDSSIYYYDLEEPDNNRRIHLYHRTTQDGILQPIARYADALQWDATGNYVIYDAFNSLPGPAGETIDFWTVNVLDPIGEALWSVFPPQPPGVHIGNPSLSSAIRPDGTLDDCRLLYERLDERDESTEIRVLDGCSGEEGVLYATAAWTPTFPGFTNGDREVIFEEWVTEDGVDRPYLWRLPVAADGLSSAGERRPFAPDLHFPKTVIFADDDLVLGTSSAVEEQWGTPRPAAFELAQNHPNPFNAETLISYAVPHASRVLVDVFNLNGQRVAVLDQGVQAAGVHAVRWAGVDALGRPLASGIYLYRLRLPGEAPGVERETRKMLLLR